MVNRFVAAAVFATVAVLPARAELPATVADRLQAAGIPEDAVGVIVRRISDGKVVLAHGADRAMQPASTLKLLTALVALETLGPAYRGRSQLRASGPVVDGVLRGDLVLRGEGDVDLDWTAFQRMLRVAWLSGIREVRGDLVVDRTAFSPARTDVGVAPFDETPEFRYNVIPDALLLNSNLLQMDLVSGARGMRVAMTPALAGVTVTPELELVDRACDDWEDGWKIPDVKTARDGSIRIVLHGTFPKECTASTAINVLDRDVFAERLFRTEWARLGGRFRGRVREAQAPAGTRLLAEHRSRPLSEILFDVDKRSDNPVARMVYLAMGAHSGTGASTLQASEREVRTWLARKGIDATGIVLENGSGLSRAERIRPEQLAAVLEAALASPWAPEFLASLPIVAVDGGMRRRLRGTPVAELGRVKTGTLRDVSAVAGYVKDDDGENCIVVAMVNHERAVKEVARPILDALLEWLAAPRELARTVP